MWEIVPKLFEIIRKGTERVTRKKNFNHLSLGGNREREIPDPIPNSEVKPLIADGTAHKSVGE
jgi:hypothetical protein